MNKKILSCALVAAMLASSVSAFSVSAAEYDDDAFGGETGNKIYSVGGILDNGQVPGESVDTITQDRTFVFDGVDDAEFTTGNFYMFDVKDVNPDDEFGLDGVRVAYDDFVSNTKTWDEFKTELKKYTGETFAWEYDDYSDASPTRQTAITKFLTAQKAIKDIDLAKYYNAEEVELFNLEALQDTMKDLKVTGLTTSELVYLTNEYERLLGESGMISPETSAEEEYNELLEKVNELLEDDYTEGNWADVQHYITKAELLAADEKFKDAIAELNKVFGVETIKPDYSDLETALEGLFDTEEDFKKAIANKNQNTEVKELHPYGWQQTEGEILIKYSYLLSDYNDDMDLWYDFAGVDKNSSKGTDYVAGAYREAVAVYLDCRHTGTRKTTAQSTVNKALENLNEAILNLDPNYESVNWVVVRLEDALDKANSIVEDDYRTTSSIYKDFLKAKENVEKLLEQDVIKEETGKSYADKLETLTARLVDARKSVPTDTKNALKDAMSEAKTALKNQTGKTATQIRNLEDAYEAAGKVTKNSKALISEYENATADLNKAMTAYNQKQGWYEGTDGLWYYGKEDSIAKGWLNVNGTWYYLDATSGAMKTGWQQVNGTWYYLNASGAMQTGWLNLNGKYYYLESWGGMATGWKNVNGSWYYLQGSGEMVANGWYWINGKCYYFRNWGGMAANTTIDGYKVGADGAWVK